MMKNRGLQVKLFALIVIVCLWVSFSFAAMNHKEILRKADMARGNYEGVQWEVHVYSIEKGREQNRKLEVKARGYDFLAILTAPPQVKRNKLLMVDHNMWFAKPGVKKPVPVSSRQKFLGGASYGDIAATNYANDYEPTQIASGEVNGEVCYLFDFKSATKKATYDRIKYWISKKRMVGIKAEYYTVSGKMFKWATFEYNNQVLIDDYPHPFISKMLIHDVVANGNITTMKFSKPELVPVPPSALDLNFLMMR